VPPYTFVATVNAVLLQHALPVFVDTDPETFQIDARKIEAALTDRTACLLPVHLGGAAADMDAILAIAKARKLPVVEDACQSHLAEWRGRKVGTLGDLGCFSFQASKNLNSGEGGAVVSNDDDLDVVSASSYSLTVGVDLTRQDRSGMTLTALARGGSGNYAYNWGIYMMADVEQGIRTIGPGSTLIIKNADARATASAIKVPHGAYVVLLNVKDRVTGAFKHHQQQVYPWPFTDDDVEHAAPEVA